MKRQNPDLSRCPTRVVLDRIANKWTVSILGLLQEHPWRFNALLKQIEGLSQKVLSQTLKRLERDGLISRKAYPTVPVTVEYSLMPLGRTLAQSLTAVIDWAKNNVDSIMVAQKKYDSLNTAEGQE